MACHLSLHIPQAKLIVESYGFASKLPGSAELFYPAQIGITKGLCRKFWLMIPALLGLSTVWQAVEKEVQRKRLLADRQTAKSHRPNLPSYLLDFLSELPKIFLPQISNLEIFITCYSIIQCKTVLPLRLMTTICYKYINTK